MIVPDTQQEYVHLADKLYGAVFGSYIGDAAGSFVSGKKKKEIPKEADKALELPGGGKQKLSPGQVGSEGQLSISLMMGLINSKNKQSQFNLQSISDQYKSFMATKPVQLPATISNAFKGLADSAKPLQLLKANSQRNQENSSSALLRAAPLAGFIAFGPIVFKDWTQQRAKELIKEETSLTHSSELTTKAVQVLVLALSDLIQKVTVDVVLSNTQRRIKEWAGELAQWWKATDSAMNSTDKPQNLKIAWTFAFYYLKKASKDQSDFLALIKDCIVQGGATQINSLIVGSMLGAYFGWSNLPLKQAQKIIRFQTKRGIDQKSLLSSKVAFLFVQALIRSANGAILNGGK